MAALVPASEQSSAARARPVAAPPPPPAPHVLEAARKLMQQYQTATHLPPPQAPPRQHAPAPTDRSSHQHSASVKKDKQYYADTAMMLWHAARSTAATPTNPFPRAAPFKSAPSASGGPKTAAPARAHAQRLQAADLTSIPARAIARTALRPVSYATTTTTTTTDAPPPKASQDQLGLSTHASVSTGVPLPQSGAESVPSGEAALWAMSAQPQGVHLATGAAGAGPAAAVASHDSPSGSGSDTCVTGDGLPERIADAAAASTSCAQACAVEAGGSAQGLKRPAPSSAQPQQLLPAPKPPKAVAKATKSKSNLSVSPDEVGQQVAQKPPLSHRQAHQRLAADACAGTASSSRGLRALSRTSSDTAASSDAAGTAADATAGRTSRKRARAEDAGPCSNRAVLTRHPLREAEADEVPATAAAAVPKQQRATAEGAAAALSRELENTMYLRSTSAPCARAAACEPSETGTMQVAKGGLISTSSTQYLPGYHAASPQLLAELYDTSKGMGSRRWAALLSVAAARAHEAACIGSDRLAWAQAAPRGIRQGRTAHKRAAHDEDVSGCSDRGASQASLLRKRGGDYEYGAGAGSAKGSEARRKRVLSEDGKVCTKCETWKELHEFPKRASARCQGICQACSVPRLLQDCSK